MNQTLRIVLESVVAIFGLWLCWQGFPYLKSIMPGAPRDLTSGPLIQRLALGFGSVVAPIGLMILLSDLMHKAQ